LSNLFCNPHDGNWAMSAASEKVEKPVLPPIPAKRYFTIGEVSELCGVKPHVLRYWEQEFTQLRPVKRRGNRRYYQHHEVLLIRRIRELLYEQGFTIHGARNRLDTRRAAPAERAAPALLPETGTGSTAVAAQHAAPASFAMLNISQLRQELLDALHVLQ
jgi:DNA-binding transcriptional MerR regulator